MSWGTTFCLITGASRGIGQAIAVEISKKLGEGSVLLLLARTQVGLDETKKLIEKANAKVHVHPVTVDLQKAGIEYYKKTIQDSLKNVKKVSTDFKRTILVHNAAAFFRKSALELEDASYIQEDLALNFISPILLNTQFFKIFGKDIEHRTVIQVSSGASQMPVSHGAMYGGIKSARNHFFRTLAVEEPTIQVLNYDPGAVETEMLKKSSKENGQSMEEAKQMFEAIGFPIIQPEETASILVEYLESGFKSGAFLNVFKNPNIYDESQEKIREVIKTLRKK